MTNQNNVSTNDYLHNQVIETLVLMAVRFARSHPKLNGDALDMVDVWFNNDGYRQAILEAIAAGPEAAEAAVRRLYK